MARNNSNGNVERNDTERLQEIVSRVEEDAKRAAAATETGITKSDPEAHSPTVAVLRHLEAVAEQAVFAQTAAIHELMTEARDMEQQIMNDLARLKQEIRTLLLNGERASALAGSIKENLIEMRAQSASLIQART